MAFGNYKEQAMQDGLSNRYTSQLKQQSDYNVQVNPTQAQAAVNRDYQRRLDEERWVAQQEEKRRQERVEEQKKYSTPNPVNPRVKDRKAQQRAEDEAAARHDASDYSWVNYVTNPVNPQNQNPDTNRKTYTYNNPDVVQAAQQIKQQQSAKQDTPATLAPLATPKQETPAPNPVFTKQDNIFVPEVTSTSTPETTPTAPVAEETTQMYTPRRIPGARYSGDYPAYTGDWNQSPSAYDASRAQYRGRELMQPMPFATTSQQARDANKGFAAKVEGNAEDDTTPFYTYRPEEEVVPQTPTSSAYSVQNRVTPNKAVESKTNPFTNALDNLVRTDVGRALLGQNPYKTYEENLADKSRSGNALANFLGKFGTEALNILMPNRNNPADIGTEQQSDYAAWLARNGGYAIPDEPIVTTTDSGNSTSSVTADTNGTPNTTANATANTAPRTTTPTTTTLTTTRPSNPINYDMGTQKSTGDLALEASIRRGDTTYDKVYDDYVAEHKDRLADAYIASGRYKTEAEAKKAAEETARRQAYGVIYDLGYRPDVNDENSYLKYVTGMSQDFVDAVEKAIDNNYYTNDASYMDRVINSVAGGFDRSYDQDRQFYDLTSELAGNAFANNTRGTNYSTTPNITSTSDVSNPLNQNGALQGALSGELTPDQVLHFYDANYSDLVVPEETQRWLASDSTHALNQYYLNNGENIERLEKEHGTSDEFYEGLRALIEANPALKMLYDSGQLSAGDIANNFLKARLDDSGAVNNPVATSNGNGKNKYFTPSYEQGMNRGVKAPYRKGGYSAAELQAMGNVPYTDANGRTQYEGYYLAPDGNWYPVDQEKAAYYQKYHTYDGWQEPMREYYNTFGTFYGYRPDWKTSGRNVSSGSGSSTSPSSSSSSSSRSSNRGYYNNYYDNNYTGNRGTANPTVANQKQNRIYNIMKNWSF